jgi:hypothetical protein
LASNWRKSSYSGGQGGQCVEVASTPGHVAIRDTTNRGSATLSVPASAWRAFAADLKRALAARQAQHQGGHHRLGGVPFCYPPAGVPQGTRKPP